MMSVLIVFPFLLCFFGVDLIIFLAWLLVYIYDKGLFFLSKVLFSSLPSRVLLSFEGSLSLSTGVLLDFWRDFLKFAFSFLKVLLLSDSSSSSGIYTLSNVSFFSKSDSSIIILDMMSSKILSFLT